MDNQKAKQLFEAIKNDDINCFDKLVTTNSDLNICFGRFPILSVCYLYNSYRILSKYEKILFSKSSFEIYPEIYEIYLKFKTYAKKSIRLFLNDEIVYPILMLAVIDDRIKIAKYYTNLYKNEKILSKLSKIYKITNCETVTANTVEFVCSNKKTTKKQKIYLSFIACLVCLALIIPIFSMIFVSNVFGIGTEAKPIRVKNEIALTNALKNEYSYISVEEDIYLTNDFTIEDFSGTINGNNKNFFISEDRVNSLISNFSGNITDVNFVIQATNLKISQSMAFFTENLTGKIENCTFSGNLNIEIVSDGEVDFAIFTLNNNGEIFNSTANVSINCENKTSHNAFLTSFAIVNNGEITNCRTKNNSYQTTTVDVSGLVIENNGTISNCENNLNICQTSADQWHPNTAGITIDNTGTIIDVKNYGEIKSISTNENADTGTDNSSFVLYSGGIAVNNIGTLNYCENNGNIFGSSVIANNYVAGIACRNLFAYSQNMFYYTITDTGFINNCVNNGKINSVSTGQNLDSITNYIGGITANNYTKVENCTNIGEIFANSTATQIYAGGIVGGSFYASNLSGNLDIAINNSVSKSDITVETKKNYIYVGGVVGFGENVIVSNSGFIGNIKINSSKAYMGGVVGYLLSNYSYFEQSWASITNSYSALTFVDNTEGESEEQKEDIKTNEQTEESQENEAETPITTKFLSNIAGLIISNFSTSNFWSEYFGLNKYVKSTIPGMQYKFTNSDTINEVDIEESKTTVFDTVDDLLEILNSLEDK